jgi:hypothetical protein
VVLKGKVITYADAVLEDLNSGLTVSERGYTTDDIMLDWIKEFDY